MPLKKFRVERLTGRPVQQGECQRIKDFLAARNPRCKYSIGATERGTRRTCTSKRFREIWHDEQLTGANFEGFSTGLKGGN